MSNLKARDALERAQRLFRERPSAAKKNVPAGRGSDSGPSPGWLLRASLASCTATAIAMRAAIRGIELRELQVTVHAETNVRGVVGIEGGVAGLDRHSHVDQAGHGKRAGKHTS